MPRSQTFIMSGWTDSALSASSSFCDQPRAVIMCAHVHSTLPYPVLPQPGTFFNRTPFFSCCHPKCTLTCTTICSLLVHVHKHGPRTSVPQSFVPSSAYSKVNLLYRRRLLRRGYKMEHITIHHASTERPAFRLATKLISLLRFSQVLRTRRASSGSTHFTLRHP